MSSQEDDQRPYVPGHGANDYSDQRNSIRPVVTDPSAQQAERIVFNIGSLALSGFVSQGGSVANFRNIQYARISGRWHEAKILDPAEQNGLVDATQWGPRAPQGLNLPHRDTGHLYPRMSLFDRQSEFECLNLNICGPRDALRPQNKGKLLPVMVWVHGGSFDFGDGGCESGMSVEVRFEEQLVTDLHIH